MAMQDVNRIIQANLNARIAQRFPKDVKNTALAKLFGVDHTVLSRTRKHAKPMSIERLAQIADRLDSTAADMLTPGRYDFTDTDENSRGVTSSVTPSHGKTSAAPSQQVGGHGSLPSASSTRSGTARSSDAASHAALVQVTELARETADIAKEAEDRAHDAATKARATATRAQSILDILESVSTRPRGSGSSRRHHGRDDRKGDKLKKKGA